MKLTMSDSQTSVCFECRKAIDGDSGAQPTQWKVVSDCWACRRRMLEALPSLIPGAARGPRPSDPALRLVTALEDELETTDWPEPA